jgi:hypothetical protein
MGQCAGLSAQSGLFSSCLKVYSSANRVAFINDSASTTAVSRAQADLNEAINEYAALSGGEEVPCDGIDVTCPSATGGAGPAQP